MVRQTLKSLVDTFSPDTIQIICGKHIVNIDCRVDGSFFIYSCFKDQKFEFKNRGAYEKWKTKRRNEYLTTWANLFSNVIVSKRKYTGVLHLIKEVK